MEIIPIFVDETNPILSSSCYKDGDIDEFSRLFKDWQDTEYLKDYFTRNKKYLENFYKNISIIDAVVKTIKDVKDFERRILSLAQDSLKTSIGLDKIFSKLHKSDYEVELIPFKAYGTEVYSDETSWLRIYGIKIETNVYVITGGLIKLTEAMQDSEEGKKELENIRRTRDYLSDNQIIDKKGLTI